MQVTSHKVQKPDATPVIRKLQISKWQKNKRPHIDYEPQHSQTFALCVAAVAAGVWHAAMHAHLSHSVYTFCCVAA